MNHEYLFAAFHEFKVAIMREKRAIDNPIADNINTAHEAWLQALSALDRYVDSKIEAAISPRDILPK